MSADTAGVAANASRWLDQRGWADGRCRLDNARACDADGTPDVTDASTLQIERTYQAPAQAVFDAWTSEEVLRRWFHAEHDWETTEAKVDLRVGGVVRVVMRDPHKDVEHGGGGHFTEIDPPKRLAFTWIWDDNPTRTLIEIEFEETDGITTVRFTHTGLWNEDAVRSHRGGWNRCFDNLQRTLQTTNRKR